MNTNIILKDFELNDSDILSIFPYGSRIYGTDGDQSDWDFIIVVRDGIQDKDSLEYSYHKINATIYNETSFKNKVAEHSISALECLFLNNSFVLKNTTKFVFDLKLNVLRESISAKASHSWVKSKKKFEVIQDRNVYIAKKSLFHSMRIIDFGIQIAKNKKITNYHSCIGLWGDIYSNPKEDWVSYKDIYQEKFNKMMTDFRKLAPKA